MTARKSIRRKLLAAHRKLREARMIAKGLLSTRHPLLAHIIPIAALQSGLRILQ